jgi:hypothetical protein
MGAPALISVKIVILSEAKDLLFARCGKNGQVVP